jgi:hypothetical protein
MPHKYLKKRNKFSYCARLVAVDVSPFVRQVTVHFKQPFNRLFWQRQFID